MELQCQIDAIKELNMLAENDSRNILIEGPSGCGKTYLSTVYSKLVDSDNLMVVKPNVNEIRQLIDDLYATTEKIVVCIENLDSGVSAASYSLLKFLEEPYSNVYVLVTCRNIYNVPDTIRSRCRVVSVSNPTIDDINLFGSNYNKEKYFKYMKTDLWKSIRAFSDIMYLYSLSDEQYSYIQNLFKSNFLNGATTDIVWRWRYFKDGSSTDIKIILKYLLYKKWDDSRYRFYISRCLDDLYFSRASERAILSYLVLRLKYDDGSEVIGA